MSNPATKRQIASATAKRQESENNLPSPWTKVPERFESFVNVLNKNKIYLLHLDKQPSKLKRDCWLVPLGMNVVITLLLLWRLYVTFPFYFQGFLSVVGHESKISIKTEEHTRGELLTITLKRLFTILLDWALFYYVSVWPLLFFFERPASPFTWRLHLGFHDNEMIVRQSKKVDRDELVDGLIKGDDSIYQSRILPEMESRYLRERTAYTMINSEWLLDFNAMIVITGMVERGMLGHKDLDKAVLVYSSNHGWIYRHTNSENGQEDGPTKEQDEKDETFKLHLTQIGKESLFYRWIEIIQYENSLSGGLTTARLEKAKEKARKEFKKKGVDFDRIFESSGGEKTVPEIEHNS